MYEHSRADHWIYSTAAGRWAVCSSTTAFTSGGGLLLSEPHHGAPPPSATAWGDTATGAAADVVVSNRRAEAHGFIIGQRVAAATTIDGVLMEPASGKGRRALGLVPLGAEGTVRGAATGGRDGVVVRFAIGGSERIATVDPDQLDTLTGPRCVVTVEGGRKVDGVAVNGNASHVKIHYVGYGKDVDEWVEQSSSRIQWLDEPPWGGGSASRRRAAPGRGARRSGRARRSSSGATCSSATPRTRRSGASAAARPDSLCETPGRSPSRRIK